MATAVRAFDGSLTDADGMLAVERDSFDESPYSRYQIRDMLTEGPQRAWLAVAGSAIVGFVVSFATHSLNGASWEIDLMAVHPSWRGRGLGTRLVRASCAYGTGLAGRARSVVSAGNQASARVFRRAGFRAAKEVCELYICRIQEQQEPEAATHGTEVTALGSSTEMRGWLAASEMVPPGKPTFSSSPQPPASAAQANHASMPRFLVAGRGSEPGGYAELIEVETLLYRGVWIESLRARTTLAREALIRDTLVRAKCVELDEVGAMVPRGDNRLQRALLNAGFRSLGEFRWFKASLPLPGWASPLPGARAGGPAELIKPGARA